jgi:hypothetical protein
MNKRLLPILLLISVLASQTHTAGDTLMFKVSGLVCSFCAHGLNKGIGNMKYTDKDKVFVDINNQIVKVVLNKKHKRLPSLIINETIAVIIESGYEVNKVFFNGRPLIK